MSKYLGLALLLFLIASACQPKPIEEQDQTLSIDTAVEAVWSLDKLSLYPIYADEDFVASNQSVAQLKTLDEALSDEKFRIVEHQPFGRFEGRDAVNRLTVENRSDALVFLMSGDIVQGGRQDRVIAEDQVIAARKIKNVDVFCVEKGRSNYHEPVEGEAENNPDIYAFKGYYNVAPGALRKQVSANNQNGVWESVTAFTSEHDAVNGTEAFAGLEAANDFTKQRDQYLDHFQKLLQAETKPMVGLVAVSGNKVIGADVFGHPDLAKRRFGALLHGYITEALTYAGAGELDSSQLTSLNKLLNKHYAEGKGLKHEQALVHLSNI